MTYDKVFRIFEDETPRLERTQNLDFILREYVDGEPSVDLLAAITRWADAHVSGGLDALERAGYAVQHTQHRLGRVHGGYRHCMDRGCNYLEIA